MRRRNDSLVTLVVAAASLASCSPGGSAAPTTVVTMHHSAFTPSVVTVPRGRDVAVELRNDDPIAHEWIVGDEETHARHRTGTEPVHDERATEVTVPPLAERTTVVRFARAGDYRFVCHLPGHEAYGMTGVLRVV